MDTTTQLQHHEEAPSEPLLSDGRASSTTEGSIERQGSEDAAEHIGDVDEAESEGATSDEVKKDPSIKNEPTSTTVENEEDPEDRPLLSKSQETEDESAESKCKAEKDTKLELPDSSIPDSATTSTPNREMEMEMDDETMNKEPVSSTDIIVMGTEIAEPDNVALQKKIVRALYLENEFSSRWKHAGSPPHPSQIMFPHDNFAQSYLAKLCQCLSLQWIFDQALLLQTDNHISQEERKAAIEAILSPLTVAIPDVVASSDEDDSSGNRSQGGEPQGQEKSDEESLSTVPVERVCPMCWSACTSTGRAYFGCPHCSSCLHFECVVAWMEHQTHQECPCCEVELMSEEMIHRHISKQRQEQVGRRQLWDIDDLSQADEGSRCGGEVVFEYLDPSVADEDLSVSVYTADDRN